MSLSQTNDLSPNCPGSIPDLREQLHIRLDQILDACEHEHLDSSMLAFETALRDRLHALGALLIRLFLLVRHRRCESESWLWRGYRVAQTYADRTLQTFCGAVRYGRDYLILRKGKGPGVHPLDVELGLTRDSYTPLLIGRFCRLCTRLSFRVACEVGGMFLGRAPAASTVEEWVLGLGKPAYQWLSTGPVPEGDGEVLVIECDGKAAPTATQEELSKRRRPHRCKEGECSCQRHRGRAGRTARGPRKRRRRGDKSKNGRSAVLVVMYTLKRGEDGRLHGPIHKKVFASFNSRRRVLAWARKQATRRGFPSGTSKTVQILIDGEVCLEQRMSKLFPGAILTLDIHHARLRSAGTSKPHSKNVARISARAGRRVGVRRRCVVRSRAHLCCKGSWRGCTGGCLRYIGRRVGFCGRARSPEASRTQSARYGIGCGSVEFSHGWSRRAPCKNYPTKSGRCC